MNKVTAISLDKGFKKKEENVKKAALEILKILNKNDISVEIYLISGQRMRSLNKKFRGKDRTTTVLSFKEPRNFILPASKFKKIGEIYLNLTNNQRPKHKLPALLVHGLLHLLGYSHQEKNDRIKMEKKEKFLISNCSNF